VVEILTPQDGAPPSKWVALLGRRDVPADGVEDYCTFLASGLSPRGVELERVRLPLLDAGWFSAFWRLQRESRGWSGRWVLLQYTAFSWSRRGFPVPARIVLSLLQRRRARVAVVFHEACRQGQGKRWIDRLRGACQDWVIRSMYRGAEKSVFTVPLETVDWLPNDANRAAFIPIGANIPENARRRQGRAQRNGEKTVIVFGITGVPEMGREVDDIAEIIRETSHTFDGVRLVAVGRGSVEAREQLVRGLDKYNVTVEIRGILPAKEVALEFEKADVLLFVRGAITTQRGSVMAGVASGIPIVGYGDRKVIGPLEEAGIEWSPSRACEDFARSLIRVLNNPTHWMELHERNLEAQSKYFTWNRIAERFRNVLAE
jgi:glycosyltransferase involved in cell wall biosynthesis